MPQKKRKSSSKKKKEVELRFLVVVRHGDYDDDYNLSQSGEEQMRELAEQLTTIVNGNRTLLLSSIAARASQSAAVISEKLGIPLEEHEILWSENRHPEDIPGLLSLIRTRKSEAEVIVLVTHLEYAERFPAYFAREELKMDMSSDWPPEPRKGEACLVNCIEKNFQLIG